MRHRVFDDEFQKMAVELSKLKGSVKDAALEMEKAGDTTGALKLNSTPAGRPHRVLLPSAI